MGRKIGFLVGLIGIIAIVIGGMKILSGRTPKQGVLKVASQPTAGIFLDNKHLGRTPYEGEASSGEFPLKLVPETTVEAIASWQGSVKISPGLLTYVNATLSQSEFTTAVDVLWLEKISSKVSEIAVATNPDGATASLDGEMKGITPVSLTNVTPGDHTLTVTSPGFLARSVKVKTTAGYKLNAAIKLALSPEGTPTPEASPTGTPTPKATPTKGSSTTPTKPYVTIKDTPTGFLRVRLEPSTSSTEAARVNPGDQFHVEDTKSGWYQIKYDGKNLGWISGQYAEKTE